MDESAKKEIIAAVPIIDTIDGDRLGTRYTVRLSQDGEEETVDIDCMIPDAPVLPVSSSSPQSAGTVNPNTSANGFQTIALRESYAALVHILFEWIGLVDDEKILEYAGKSVRFAVRRHNVFTNGVAQLNKPTDELYGMEYEEYVDEACLPVIKKLQDLEAFLIFLEGKMAKKHRYFTLRDMLYNGAINAINNNSKKFQRRENVSPFDDYLTLIDPASSAAGIDTRALLDSIEKSLEQPEQDVYRLVVLRGYKVKDAAKELGCSASTISRCMQRIRETVDNCLQSYCI